MREPGTEALEPETKPLEVPGEMLEPELLAPQAEATLACTKKRRKKEKRQDAMMEPATEVVEPKEEAVEPKEEVVEPELPGAVEPQADLTSAKKKKKKKERERRMTEPGTEMITPHGR